MRQFLSESFHDSVIDTLLFDGLRKALTISVVLSELETAGQAVRNELRRELLFTKLEDLTCDPANSLSGSCPFDESEILAIKITEIPKYRFQVRLVILVDLAAYNETIVINVKCGGIQIS